MNIKIRTWILCGFSMITVLLGVVGVVALDRTERIADLARDLNDRVVDKTRIAADVVSLAQQVRFVDAFVLQVGDAEQAGSARRVIVECSRALDGKVASYRRYVDSDLERTLLQNLDRNLSAYLAVQRDVLDGFGAGGARDPSAAEARLDAAFEQVRRQAKGLSVLAETEARAARGEATALTDRSRSLVLAVTGVALATAVLIALLLMRAVFRPLARVTEALIALAKGDLEVQLPGFVGVGEVDAIVRALDVFRRNAAALSAAHAETRAAHERADALARHDVLTGLPNRRVLSCAIEEAIARSERRGSVCAVLLLDLDRFKPVNDVYGHGAGDRVLREVASRLVATVRTGETAARLGGDEFAVVVEYEPGTDAPHRVAKRIASSVAEPITIEGRSVSVGTSIGVSVWPSDGGDAEALLRAADLAMFKAKRDDRGNFRFYEPEMDVQVRERADLEARLQQAIERGDVRPHYQPLVDLAEDVVTGFEVLARWYDGGRVRPPSEFIPVAEEAGLIAELTYAVLRQACRDCLSWPGELTLAVNVTPAQISDRQLPGVLMRIMSEEGLAPSRLEVEITENALIGDVTSAKAVIEDLRGRGVKVSLDDFGTGYSSLHHLRDLKFDKIKIDRSFVQTMSSNPESAKIVEIVLSLGRSLGMSTVAEGIEGEEHLRRLIGYGCQYGQGYHLGRPIAATAVRELIEGRHRPVVPLVEAA